jgi:outer membrane biosynthesis protein TonB
MMKTQFRRPFKWGFIHTALLVSLVVHIIILIVAGILSPRKVTLNTDFKVILVDSFNILTEEAELPPGGGEPRDPAQAPDTIAVAAQPLPPQAEPQQPPSLPSTPVFEISDSTGTSPGSAPAAETGSTTGNTGSGGTGSPGTGDGTGSGPLKKVTGVDLEGGCKLFILPPFDHPLTIEEAMPYCEGISPAEMDLARTIEFTAVLSESGQPSEVTLTQSCGNREVDKAAQELMQFMRFETSSLKHAPLYHLTLVIIGKKQ